MDKKIICRDCGQEFVFTVEEQEFFKSKEFEDPKRCQRCRITRRENSFGSENRSNGNILSDQPIQSNDLYLP